MLFVEALAGTLLNLFGGAGVGSEAECTAADEDGGAQGDQHDREQDVFLAFQYLGDRPTGRDELGHAH